ncbi:MAG: sulfatase-like hydrolase/transferase [SAR324 cluster bacterium]|uniref:Sulfatase-like hydrolase/transferase n=1 Tax=SAR324 cluster bacterium TaxID=2024889 RepID=A0A7X9FS55_9DELT|nr:sulfatase-like hydrolase/transferase [SAR324 cluster bacterium]
MRLIIAPFALLALFLGARSSIGHRPANLSTACFSGNHLANEFALNSTYTVTYAAQSCMKNLRQTHLDATKYADYAIGLLFDLANKEKYFQNTIFLVVADHNSHVYGNEHVPIDEFHIPGLLVGRNVSQMEAKTQAS